MIKKEKLVVFLVALISLVICTFTDLQISTALYTKNIFGVVFEIVGELPAVFLVVLGCTILFKYRSKKNIVTNLLLGTFYSTLILLFAFMGGFMTMNYLSDNIHIEIPTIFNLLFGCLIILCSVLITRKIPQKFSNESIAFAITALIYFLFIIILINVTKGIWGRMRMREITDPILQFTPWYVITNRGGFDNQFASFPSGHAANSAVIILITLLPTFLENLKGREILLKIFAYTWLVFVMISRIIMGAHFATDVIVGATLSLLSFLLLKTIVYRFLKINFDKKGAFADETNYKSV